MLRDTDPKQNFDKIVQMVKDDVHKIYQEVKEIEAYKDCKIDDKFAIECFKLPHMMYAEKEFKAEAAKLAMKFEEGRQSLFNGIDIQHLPASDFAEYVGNIWLKIKQQKEIDLVIIFTRIIFISRVSECLLHNTVVIISCNLSLMMLESN